MAKKDHSLSSLLKDNISDWVKKLTLSKKPILDFDARKEYRDHIIKKYQKL